MDIKIVVQEFNPFEAVTEWTIEVSFGDLIVLRAHFLDDWVEEELSELNAEDEVIRTLTGDERRQVVAFLKAMESN